MQNIIIIESESVCNMHFYSLLYSSLPFSPLPLQKPTWQEHEFTPSKINYECSIQCFTLSPLLKKKKMNIYFLFSRHSIFFPKELGIFKRKKIDA